MRFTKLTRSSVMSFSLALIAFSSGAAAASGWIRVPVGVPGQPYGGNTMNCATDLPTFTSGGSVGSFYCPVPDTSTLPASSYTSASVFFQNSNATQPAQACVAYYDRSGGACGPVTSNNNCPNRGACSFSFDISAWANNPNHFKYAVFSNITQGVNIAGFDLFY